MKRPAWAWLALSSLAFATAPAATRPHYGGSLTVELYAGWIPVDSAASALSIPITETLVRLNPRGGIDPVLCVAWQHDSDFKRWRFSVRPKVTFHDGEPLTGATAAPSLLAALKKKYADVSIQTGGQALVIQSAAAMPDLLDDLAAPDTAIFRKNEANPPIPLIGTGPFRITAWEPGRRLSLAAFDDYWNGRPYLDSVIIEFGSGHTRADIFDIPAGPTRRVLPEGIATWSSAPRTLVAITAANAPSRVIAGACTGDRSRAHRQRPCAAQGRSGVQSAAAMAHRLCVPVSVAAGSRSRETDRLSAAARRQSASATRRTMHSCDPWPSALP